MFSIIPTQLFIVLEIVHLASTSYEGNKMVLSKEKRCKLEQIGNVMCLVSQVYYAAVKCGFLSKIGKTKAIKTLFMILFDKMCPASYRFLFL